MNSTKVCLYSEFDYFASTFSNIIPVLRYIYITVKQKFYGVSEINILKIFLLIMLSFCVKSV